MSTTLNCDNPDCTNTTTDDFPMRGWLRLEWLSSMATYGDDPSEKHFCSYRCLSVYADLLLKLDAR